MNPVDRLFAFLWDPDGRRRAAQSERIASTEVKIRGLQDSQRRAIDQVRRTQLLVQRTRRPW